MDNIPNIKSEKADPGYDKQLELVNVPQAQPLNTNEESSRPKPMLITVKEEPKDQTTQQTNEVSSSDGTNLSLEESIAALTGEVNTPNSSISEKTTLPLPVVKIKSEPMEIDKESTSKCSPTKVEPPATPTTSKATDNNISPKSNAGNNTTIERIDDLNLDFLDEINEELLDLDNVLESEKQNESNDDIIKDSDISNAADDNILEQIRLLKENVDKHKVNKGNKPNDLTRDRSNSQASEISSITASEKNNDHRNHKHKKHKKKSKKRNRSPSNDVKPTLKELESAKKKHENLSDISPDDMSISDDDPSSKNATVYDYRHSSNAVKTIIIDDDISLIETSSSSSRLPKPMIVKQELAHRPKIIKVEKKREIHTPSPKKIKLEPQDKTEDHKPLIGKDDYKKLMDKVLHDCTKALKRVQLYKKKEHFVRFLYTPTKLLLPESEMVKEYRSPLLRSSNVRYKFSSTNPRIPYNEFGIKVLPDSTTKISKLLGMDIAVLKDLMDQYMTGDNPYSAMKHEIEKKPFKELSTSSYTPFYASCETQTDHIPCDECLYRKLRPRRDVACEAQPVSYEIEVQTEEPEDLPIMKKLRTMNANKLLAVNDFAALLDETTWDASDSASRLAIRDRLLQYFKEGTRPCNVLGIKPLNNTEFESRIIPPAPVLSPITNYDGMSRHASSSSIMSNVVDPYLANQYQQYQPGYLMVGGVQYVAQTTPPTSIYRIPADGQPLRVSADPRVTRTREDERRSADTNGKSRWDMRK